MDQSGLKQKRIEELRAKGAHEQARAIASNEIDSVELIAAEAAAISRQNAQLNAFLHVISPDTNYTGKPAHVSALSGTSFAVKDNFDIAGMATQAGLAALNAAPAKRDASVVSRLKQAGLVLTGKTNMSPMALGASTHNTDYGDCYNPGRAGYSAGGSSGGSASAVAAGLVGIALGTDTMGSVRIPAAFCGIVGFKPSWGHLPVEGLVPLCRSLDHIGILSRTVEDAELAYSIMRNTTSSTSNTKSKALQNSNQSTPGTRSIGVLEIPTNLPLQPIVKDSYNKVCKQLEQQGHKLSLIKLDDINLSRARRAGLLLSEAELLTTLEGVYPEHKQSLPQELVGLLDYIQKQSAKKLGQANADLAEFRGLFSAWFENVNTILLPTSTHTAFPMNGPVPADVADFTVIANILGAPAISLPVLPEEDDQDSLPVGVQLVGRYGEDDDLLMLAKKLNQIL